MPLARTPLGVAALATALAMALAIPSAGCVAAGERTLRSDLERAGDTLAELPQHPDAAQADGDDREVAPVFDGDPAGYVAYALANHPGLRASWERWRAATHRIARERRLPMPELRYGVFVSQIETRVGPQRHKLSVRQAFPWPGELLRGADAATSEARAMQREFEARALEVRAEVLRAYWELWLIRRVTEVEDRQLGLWESVAEITRTRMKVSAGSLADVQRVDLTRARLADQLEGHRGHERQFVAELLAATSAPPDTDAPTAAVLPAIEVPTVDEVELRADLGDHPLLQRWREREQAGHDRVREARSARAPALSVGVEWIEVGPASSASVDASESGRDALVVGVGIQLPLWQSNYAEDQRAAEADAAAARAEWAAARDRAAADLAVVLVGLEDSGRRAVLHQDTLIPLGTATLESTAGAYMAGEGSLDAIVAAQQVLLELELESVRLHAAHAVAWAELERVVGHSVPGAPWDESTRTPPRTPPRTPDKTSDDRTSEDHDG